MTTHLRPAARNLVSLSVAISILLIAASLFVFSLNKAIAKTPEIPIPAGTSSDQTHVVDGKLYYFDNNGKLYFIDLKDARQNYNY